MGRFGRPVDDCRRERTGLPRVLLATIENCSETPPDVPQWQRPTHVPIDRYRLRPWTLAGVSSYIPTTTPCTRHMRQVPGGNKWVVLPGSAFFWQSGRTLKYFEIRSSARRSTRCVLLNYVSLYAYPMAWNPNVFRYTVPPRRALVAWRELISRITWIVPPMCMIASRQVGSLWM